MSRYAIRRPHFKNGRDHPKTCQCRACRIWRANFAAWRRLQRLERLTEREGH